MNSVCTALTFFKLVHYSKDFCDCLYLLKDLLIWVLRSQLSS